MCGICLVIGNSDAAEVCRDVLAKLQHRGQEGAKICAADNGQVIEFGGAGLVIEELVPAEVEAIKGNWAIGHTRYSTAGLIDVNNVQPFQSETTSGTLVFAHNGQFGTSFDIEKRRKAMMEKGIPLQHTSDSELFMAEFSLSDKKDINDKLIDAFRANPGSASIVGTIDGIGFAGRKFGNRPLFMGKVDKGYVFTSEDYMFPELGIKDVESVPPGTLCIVKDGKLTKLKIWDNDFQRRFCIFELFYFSHPLTSFEGVKISEIRKGFGEKLAQEHKMEADVVTSVPDSGNHAALGFAYESGIPLDYCIVRNHYTGRTFIGGKKKERDQKSKLKYDVNPATVKGKRVVVVDDSLVRSTTSKTIVKKLKRAGAKEIYFLLASPPIKFPNYYGIDMKTREELAAANIPIDKLADHLGIDYVGYLSLEGAYEVISEKTGKKVNHGDFCDACFTGEYWDITLPKEEMTSDIKIIQMTSKT